MADVVKVEAINAFSRFLSAISLVGLLVIAVWFARHLPPTQFDIEKARSTGGRELTLLKQRIPVYSVNADVDVVSIADVTVNGDVSVGGKIDLDQPLVFKLER